MRQSDIELVTVGPVHAEKLRSIWLEMLATSVGVFHERLDEAMALRGDQWRERADQLNSPSSTLIAVDYKGRFVGIVGGFVDRFGEEPEGHLGYFHVLAGPAASLPARDRVASLLLRAFADWLAQRGAEWMFMGIREDQVALLQQMLDLGFVPTGTRRPSDLDIEYIEIELARLCGGVDHADRPHSAGGAVGAPASDEYGSRLA